MNMKFKIGLGHSVDSVEGLFPTGFALRFKLSDTESVDVAFDFKSFRYEIQGNGKVIACCASDLNMNFPLAHKLKDLLLSCPAKWLDFGLLCSNEFTAYPITACSVSIDCDGHQVMLPGYSFVHSIPYTIGENEANKYRMAMLQSINMLKDCGCIDKEWDAVRLHEIGGICYLRSLSGDGVYFDMKTKEVGILGNFKPNCSRGKASSVVHNTLERISELAVYDLGSITIAVNEAKGGVFANHLSETGSYYLTLL
jgi:hypothetical protein